MKTVKIHKICYNWSAPNMQSNMLVPYQFVIFLNWFILIFLKIRGLCLSFLLDWFELQREEFMLWHEEESEQIENTEKKIIWREWTNGSTCHLYLSSKLVIFKKFWMCLVIPQTLGEGRLLEFTQIKNK